jgi:hypothetical protein
MTLIPALIISFIFLCLFPVSVKLLLFKSLYKKGEWVKLPCINGSRDTYKKIKDIEFKFGFFSYLSSHFIKVTFVFGETIIEYEESVKHSKQEEKFLTDLDFSCNVVSGVDKKLLNRVKYNSKFGL